MHTRYTVCLYNVTEEIKFWWDNQTLAVCCLLNLLPRWHFSTLFIGIFITEEATGDGWEELSTKGSWGHHSPSDRSTSDICLQFMWHIPHRPRSEQICQRVWRIIEIAGGTLTLIPLIPLSPPLPDIWHPVIFLWPFHTATTILPLCVHCSQILTHPTLQCGAMSATGLSLASTLSPSLLQLYYTFSSYGWPGSSPHVWPSLTHCCTVVLPTAKTISRNLYMLLLQLSPTLYSSSYAVYHQPDTKTYQVTIWGRLSPTDINVGTWIFWGSWPGYYLLSVP